MGFPYEILREILHLRLLQLTLPTHQRQLEDLKSVDPLWQMIIEADPTSRTSFWFNIDLPSPWVPLMANVPNEASYEEQRGAQQIADLLQEATVPVRRVGISMAGEGGKISISRLLDRILATSESWEELNVIFRPRNYPELWPLVRASLGSAIRLTHLTFSCHPSDIFNTAIFEQEILTLNTVEEITYVGGVPDVVLAPSARVLELHGVTIDDAIEASLCRQCRNMDLLHTIILNSVSADLGWAHRLQTRLTDAYAEWMGESSSTVVADELLCNAQIRVIFTGSDHCFEGQYRDATLPLKFMLISARVRSLTVCFSDRNSTFDSLFFGDLRWFDNARSRGLCLLRLKPTLTYNFLAQDVNHTWIPLLFGGVLSTRPGRELEVQMHNIRVSTGDLSTAIASMHRNPQISLVVLNCIIHRDGGGAYDAWATSKLSALPMMSTTMKLILGENRMCEIKDGLCGPQALAINVITRKLDNCKWLSLVSY